MSAAPTRCRRDVWGHVRHAVTRCDRTRAQRGGRRHATKAEATAALREIAELIALVGLTRPAHDDLVPPVLDAIEKVAGSWEGENYHDGRRSCCAGGSR